MTENQLRKSIIDTAAAYAGAKQGDERHAEILAIYNGQNPLPRGYKVKKTDSWCATFVSAVFIKANLADLIGLECGCGEMVALAQKMGIWCENDAYKPNVGDIILYDWQDTGKGDNVGWPDHVGIVEEINGSGLTIIEGNLNKAVARRTLLVNDKFIRGYIVPNYASKATKEAKKKFGITTTALYLRQGPGTNYDLCGIDRRDGNGYRKNLLAGEKVEIIGTDKKTGWFNLRIECGKDVLLPWASNKYIVIDK